jgi:predicted ferric reductase
VIARVAAYAGLLTLPLLVTAITGKTAKDPLPVILATRFALLAFTIVALQFVVSARLRWVERPFGLDMVFRFHKAMAVFLVALVLSHPLLLVAGSAGWGLLFSLDVHWPVWVARGMLPLLLFIIAVSLFRLPLRFEYQRWRATHNVVVGVVLVAAFVHSRALGEDLTSSRLMQGVWIALAAAAASAYAHHRALVPRRARQQAYRVTRVTPEARDVWTLELAPSGRGFGHLPGQFAFLTLFREQGLPVEEHPFTISSSPTETGTVTFTIKASGDYTSTIGRTTVGDRAAVEGPYGRFSYPADRPSPPLLFIAGGIGITPLMSMLRHMAEAEVEADTLLLYGNRREADIVFAEELAVLVTRPRPRLRVVHVLSSPGPAWSGVRGRIDGAAMAAHCPDLVARVCCVCGPPAMMTAVSKALLAQGVPAAHIHSERFAL